MDVFNLDQHVIDKYKAFPGRLQNMITEISRKVDALYDEKRFCLIHYFK